MQIDPQREKIETFLAIAGVLGFSDGDSAGDAFVLPEDFDHLTAFNGEIRNGLSRRASTLNRVPEDRRRVWLALWNERLRRRGHTRRLDANVHPEQIAHVLRDEPPSVRMIIESHLPDEIAEKVAIILQSTSLFTFVKSEARGNRPDLDPKMIEIVRKRFLDNFTAFEDLFEPTEMEQFSMRELGNFIWHLGLREIAFVCRGISRKENLGGFLKQFDEETAIEIGNRIAAAGEVRLERVKLAEERAKAVFQMETNQEERVRRLGMDIFAETLARRPGAAVRFNLQKLPVNIAEGLDMKIRILRRDAQDSASDALVAEVEQLSVSFRKGGIR